LDLEGGANYNLSLLNRNFKLAVGLALTGGVFAACLQGPRIQLELCSDLRVPEEIDTMRISLIDEGGHEVSQGLVILDPRSPLPDGGCEGELATFPQNLALSGGSGSSWVRVQGLKDGVEIARAEARVEFPVSGESPASVLLSADCLGVHCPAGQTCVTGACEITQFGGTPALCDTLSQNMRGPEVDAGSSSDGGPSDASLDGGAPACGLQTQGATP